MKGNNSALFFDFFYKNGQQDIVSCGQDSMQQRRARLISFFNCIICCCRAKNSHCCPHCNKMTCYDCVKRWFNDKKGECVYCKRPLKLKDMVDCSKLINQLFESISFVLESDNQEECVQHKQSMNYYCKTCVQPLCSDCAIFTDRHSKHSIVHLKKVFEEKVGLVEQQLQLLKSKIRHKEKRLDQINKSIMQQQNEKETKHKSISSYIKRVQKQIQDEDKLYEAQVQKAKSLLLNQLTRVRKFNQSFKNKLATIPKGQIIRDWKKYVSEVNLVLDQRISLESQLPEEPFTFIKEIIPPYVCGSLIVQKFSQKRRDLKIIYSDMVKDEGTSWRLKVYPNGNEVVDGVYLSVFLEMAQGGDRPIFYDYQIELINQLIPEENSMRQFQSQYMMGECWGYNKFFKLDSLQQDGFLTQEDRLEFKFYVRPLTYHEKTLEQNMYIAQLERTLSELRKDNSGVRLCSSVVREQ